MSDPSLKRHRPNASTRKRVSPLSICPQMIRSALSLCCLEYNPGLHQTVGIQFFLNLAVHDAPYKLKKVVVDSMDIRRRCGIRQWIERLNMCQSPANYNGLDSANHSLADTLDERPT
jgi:hypothetical protein